MSCKLKVVVSLLRTKIILFIPGDVFLCVAVFSSPGCGGSVNRSFGVIQVGRRGYYSSSLRCNWAIGDSGINQATLIISFEDLYISSYL